MVLVPTFLSIVISLYKIDKLKKMKYYQFFTNTTINAMLQVHSSWQIFQKPIKNCPLNQANY